MTTEIEARFRASRHETLDDLAAAERLGAAALGPTKVVHELDRYLDTSDGRLDAVRWACRLRRREGTWRVSLKGPPIEGAAPPPAWLHARPELDGPASGEPEPDGWPPSEARTRLLELSGGGTLVERLRLRQRRTERAVTLGPRRLGTLSLDEVRVEREGRDAAAFRVVELELLDGAPREALASVAGVLSGLPGLAPDPRTKLEHALTLIAG